jgi:hypothetical protein
MKTNVTLPLVVPALLSSLAVGFVACSSSDTAESGSALIADAGFDALAHGGLPCNINSGFPGDSLCITPPDPTVGFQAHYGPADYTNAAEVANYVLMPGEETTDCIFFMSANTDAVYTEEYHVRMRPGSHHMLLYTQPPGSATDGGISETTPDAGPGACNQGLQTRNLFGATTPSLDVVGLSAAPENKGLAVEIPGSQQMIMQVHFINTTSQPILKEVWANTIYTPKSEVSQLGDPIFFLGGLGMSVALGQKVTIHGTAKVPTNAGKDFRLVLAEPHFHTHLTRYEVDATIDGKTETLLEQFPVINTLSEPIIRSFDTVTKNPVIDVADKVAGAYSGAVYLKPGDTIDWYCDVYNDDQPQPLTFVEHVYTGEMCNLFGLYAPTTGGPWSAYNL